MKTQERKIPLIYAVGVIAAILLCLLAVLTLVFASTLRQLPSETSAIPTVAQEAAMPVPPTFTRVPTATPTERPQPTYTLQATLTPLPTYTPLPTSTPYPAGNTEAELDSFVAPTTPLQSVGSEAEFRTYIRQKYGVIAGTPLEIENVGVRDTTVSIQLSENSARFFADQTRSAATEYGENLLQDAVSYFGNRDSVIRVFELFYTFYLSDTYFDDEWYYIGSYDVDDGWPVYKDYIWGFYYSDGRQSLRVWNYR